MKITAKKETDEGYLTTMTPSGRGELAVSRWLGKANTVTPFSVATARTCWSPCGGSGVVGVTPPPTACWLARQVAWTPCSGTGRSASSDSEESSRPISSTLDRSLSREQLGDTITASESLNKEK